MTPIYAVAEQFGIPFPVLERYTYQDAYGTLTSALTSESEARWSNYLRAVHTARINANANR